MNAQNLYDTYFENIRILSGLLFSNSRFALELFGDSLSSSLPHVCRASDDRLACSSPSCHALFVHRHSFVVDDESFAFSDDEDCVLKFVCKNIGPVVNGDYVVSLSPTADTRTLLETDCFGLSAEAHVTDDNDTDEHLFWKDSPAGSFPQRLLFCYSPFIELSEFSSSAGSFDQKAVRTTIAIASKSWPTAAVSWLAQSHPWISCGVISDVASTTVYFVPKSTSRCHVTNRSQTCLFWKPVFFAAEDVLMRCLSTDVKIAYQLLLQCFDIHRFDCCCVQPECLIKHALFWCLDELSLADDWSEKSATHYYVHTLQTLHLFLHRRHFPHYFMPDVNMLSNCDSTVCDISWMKTAFTDVASVELKTEVTRQILTCTSFYVTGSISRHLKALFAYSVSMSFIQLFQHLHSGTSVDHMISQHLNILNHIRSMPLDSSQLFLKPLCAWINSSLGNVYLVKAYIASAGYFVAEFIEKAEHCLLEAVANHNMPCCTLYLIHFLLHKKCHKVATSYLEALLSDTELTQFCAIKNPNLTEKNCLNCASAAFSDELLTVWHEAIWHSNILFSPLEVSVLLPQLESSLSFAYCDKIGLIDLPVAVLKADFWVPYIGALSYMKDDVARTLKFLADAERNLIESELPPLGASDRYFITYCNVLAGMIIG